MNLHHFNSIKSEPHTICHENCARNLQTLLQQEFGNSMLTMHIVQILVRIRRVLSASSWALRYFPENALHHYHEEVSTPGQITTAMYTSTSYNRSPAPCSHIHLASYRPSFALCINEVKTVVIVSV